MCNELSVSIEPRWDVRAQLPAPQTPSCGRKHDLQGHHTRTHLEPSSQPIPANSDCAKHFRQFGQNGTRISDCEHVSVHFSVRKYVLQCAFAPQSKYPFKPTMQNHGAPPDPQEPRWGVASESPSTPMRTHLLLSITSPRLGWVWGGGWMVGGHDQANRAPGKLQAP